MYKSDLNKPIYNFKVLGYKALKSSGDRIISTKNYICVRSKGWDDNMEDSSISIVNYQNDKEVLDKVDALESIIGQKINWIVYVLDNSSYLDNSTVLKEGLAAKPHAKYIQTKNNLGFGRAHNIAIQQANSRYHLIMNPDIEINSNSIEPLISYLDQHSKTGMIVPRITRDDGELQDAYRQQLTVMDMFIRMFCKKLFPKRMAYHSLQNCDYTHPFQLPFAQGCFLLARTEYLRQLGGFDENFFMYLEDADLCRRMNLVSKVEYVPFASVVHHWAKGSHHNLKLFKIHVKSMMYYFRKWGIQWI